jgi:hypothetical protein
VNADDVPADTAPLVEQVEGEGGMPLCDILEDLAHRRTFRLERARTAGDGAQHRRNLNADHVA